MSEPANEPFAFSNTFIKGNHGNEFNARFINSDIYGTRATTIITIDQENLCLITERSSMTRALSKKINLNLL